MTARVRAGLLAGAAAAVAFAAVGLFGIGPTADAMPPTVFRVTLTNMTNPPTPIAPGALVGHCEDGAFWSVGGTASAELELLAEVSDPSAAVALEQRETAMGNDFIQERYAIGVVHPGESVSVDVIFEFGCKLSSAHMLIFSNDTFVGAQSVGMWDPDTHLPIDAVEVELTAYDAGTEANTEPGSGFDGGQPDPSRGADNLDNGEATAEPISASTQYTGVQATLRIEYIESADSGAPLPNAGGGGLLAESNTRSHTLTATLAAVALAATIAAAVGIRRLRRTQH